MLKLKVFATDLNPKILDIASVGSYPDTISKKIPQALVALYLTGMPERLV
ncbi:MAG: CheR family methyltransferase [Glaciecola sp.]|jgi:chemotaxis methyl-accepting protein methylase|nr:CheR family methyltransferase [Glaciecola sp.]